MPHTHMDILSLPHTHMSNLSLPHTRMGKLSLLLSHFHSQTPNIFSRSIAYLVVLIFSYSSFFFPDYLYLSIDPPTLS